MPTGTEVTCRRPLGRYSTAEGLWTGEGTPFLTACKVKTLIIICRPKKTQSQVGFGPKVSRLTFLGGRTLQCTHNKQVQGNHPFRDQLGLEPSQGPSGPLRNYLDGSPPTPP